METHSVPSAESLWAGPRIDHLGTSILCTVAYADVFDYPLTTPQIQRYLLGFETSLDEVMSALDDGQWAGRRLRRGDAYLTLPWREELVETRRRRAEVATRMWPRAVRYGRTIARLPFVRAVILTGALAMSNVERDDDFDFLVITAADRLWLTRAMIIGFIVKPAARHGREVCPNYLLSEQTLDFQEQNLYVAHELSQMVPLVGLDIYGRIRAANQWTTTFLPNATGLHRPAETAEPSSSPARALAERALGTFVGGQLERFERRRKIRRFTAHRPGSATACFDVNRCKGHFDSHEQTILQAFDERLQALADL